MFELASLHQKVTHFPIAFLVFYPLIELIGLIKKSDFIDKVSLIFLISGLAGLLLSLVTGNLTLSLYKDYTNYQLEIINKHIEYANLSAWFAGILFLIRIYFRNRIKSKYFIRIVILLLSFATMFFIFKAGEYGGKTNEIILHQKKYFQTLSK
jgi:uncharacterized membrane protein